MDDLQLLREMRSDIGSAQQATLARGREKVMAKISPASTSGARTAGTPKELSARSASGAVSCSFRRLRLCSWGESSWQMLSGPMVRAQRLKPPKS